MPCVKLQLLNMHRCFAHVPDSSYHCWPSLVLLKCRVIDAGSDEPAQKSALDIGTLHHLKRQQAVLLPQWLKWISEQEGKKKWRSVMLVPVHSCSKASVVLGNMVVVFWSCLVARVVWCQLVTWPGWWVLPRHVLVCVRGGSSGGTAEARPLGPAGRRTSKSRAGARQCKGLAERVSVLPSRYVRRFRHGCLACCKVRCGRSQVGAGVTNASEFGVTSKLELVLKWQGLMLGLKGHAATSYWRQSCQTCWGTCEEMALYLVTLYLWLGGLECRWWEILFYVFFFVFLWGRDLSVPVRRCSGCKNSLPAYQSPLKEDLGTRGSSF